MSDAALSIAIGCEIKWLYNSARRLNRDVRRSSGTAVWWRLVHHLAVDLGIPLLEASRSADLLLAPGMTHGRVRLRATRDDSVAVAVDLARFHDGAAMALAAAQYLAVPRARGRPRKQTEHAAGWSPIEMEIIVRLRALSDSQRLERALRGDSQATEPHTPATTALLRLVSDGVPCAVVGTTAAAFHCAPWASDSLDLCIDMSGRYAGLTARALTSLGAAPRGVGTREGFRLDPALLGAVPILALRAGDNPVNLFSSIPGIGEYHQVTQFCDPVSFAGHQVLIMSPAGLLRSGVMGRTAEETAARMRWVHLATQRESPSGGSLGHR